MKYEEIIIFLKGIVQVCHPDYQLKTFHDEKEQDKVFSWIPFLKPVATWVCCIGAYTSKESMCNENTAVVCLDKKSTTSIWSAEWSKLTNSGLDMSSS